MLRLRAIARNFAATIRSVSELVLIAADVYRAASGVPQSPRALPSLSRIARYGTVVPLSAGWRAWLAVWLGREELAGSAPASIASAATAAGAEAGAAVQSAQPYLWLAEPVHLVVGPTSVHLGANGRLALDPEAQQALCSAFDESFAQSGYRLEPLRGGGFLARGSAPCGEVHTTEPARALGTSIAAALPSGRGARSIRALGAEIEMWMHEHPLNARRARAGRPPISTLWFWGGGPPLGPTRVEEASEAPGAAIFGDDPVMEGLANLTGARFGAAPSRLEELAARRDSRRVVALELLRSTPGSPPSGAPELDPHAALERFERDWVAPALAQLRSGELARLTILANDRRLSIGARDRFRLWRRPRAALAALR